MVWPNTSDAAVTWLVAVETDFAISQARYPGLGEAAQNAKALEASMVSAQSALDATMAGFDVGTRTMVDVLNAQRDLYGAKRNHARARYLYVLNLLTLEQAAGTLDVEDLQRVNAWLE